MGLFIGYVALLLSSKISFGVRYRAPQVRSSRTKVVHLYRSMRHMSRTVMLSDVIFLGPMMSYGALAYHAHRPHDVVHSLKGLVKKLKPAGCKHILRITGCAINPFES